MLIDSHCHLPDKKYSISTDQIIKEAFEEDVVKLINIGTSIENNKASLGISAKYKNVYTAIGIYPHENLAVPLSQLKIDLEKQINENKIVAVGECGIDITNHGGGRSVEEQVELFKMQAELAVDHKIPLIVHNRNGDDYIIEILNSMKKNGISGVIHCFDSNWEFAKKILDLNFYISFSGMITYPNKSDLIEVVESVPLDRFLVETDSPYLPLQSQRGQVNYPKYVKMVASKVSEIKKISFEDISLASYNNTCKLFKI